MREDPDSAFREQDPIADELAVYEAVEAPSVDPPPPY